MGKRIIFEKNYDRPDITLCMSYLRADKGDKRIFYHNEATNFYRSEALKAPLEEELPNLREVFGSYCMKCGHFEEDSTGEYESLCCLDEDFQKERTCKCGKKFTLADCLHVNMSSIDRKIFSSIRPFPEKVRITEQEGKLNVSVIARHYYLNPIAKKPYSRMFQMTVVINTVSGQSYIMPPKFSAAP
jgi:hypothetical protein